MKQTKFECVVFNPFNKQNSNYCHFDITKTVIKMLYIIKGEYLSNVMKPNIDYWDYHQFNFNYLWEKYIIKE